MPLHDMDADDAADLREGLVHAVDFATAANAPLIRLAAGNRVCLQLLLELEKRLTVMTEPTDHLRPDKEYPSAPWQIWIAARAAFWEALGPNERRARNNEQGERNVLSARLLPVAASNFLRHQIPACADVLTVMRYCACSQNKAVLLLGGQP